MKIYSTELKKYVVENEMGDGRKEIKVKFVYKTYLFDKCVSKKEVYDIIPFKSFEKAEEYAKHALAPSTKSNVRAYRERGYQLNGTVYNVYTDYSDSIKKLDANLDEFRIKGTSDKYYDFRLIYVTYDHCVYNNVYRDSLVSVDASKFVIANVNPDNYKYNESIWFPMNGRETFVYYEELEKNYESFKKMYDGLVESWLKKEKQKRLSATLIKFNETCIDGRDKHNLEEQIQTTALDESRNELIKEELKRVSEYSNFLKSLLK